MPRRYSLQVRELIRSGVWDPDEPGLLMRLPVHRPDHPTEYPAT
jgi:hypothetical protein